MNYGYNTTQAQGSGSDNNTGSDTGGGNKGNIPNFGNIGGNSSGSAGGGDDRNNNNKLPPEPKDKLTNNNSLLLYLRELFSAAHLALSISLSNMQHNFAESERVSQEDSFFSGGPFRGFRDELIDIENLETILNNLRIYAQQLSTYPNNDYNHNLRVNVAYIISEIELFLGNG